MPACGVSRFKPNTSCYWRRVSRLHRSFEQAVAATLPCSGCCWPATTEEKKHAPRVVPFTKNRNYLVDGTPINSGLRRLPILLGHEVHNRHGAEQLLRPWVNLTMQNAKHVPLCIFCCELGGVVMSTAKWFIQYSYGGLPHAIARSTAGIRPNRSRVWLFSSTFNTNLDGMKGGNCHQISDRGAPVVV